MTGGAEVAADLMIVANAADLVRGREASLMTERGPVVDLASQEVGLMRGRKIADPKVAQEIRKRVVLLASPGGY